MDVNCTGVWLCTKYELKQMLKQESVAVYVLDDRCVIILR